MRIILIWVARIVCSLKKQSPPFCFQNWRYANRNQSRVLLKCSFDHIAKERSHRLVKISNRSAVNFSARLSFSPVRYQRSKARILSALRAVLIPSFCDLEGSYYIVSECTSRSSVEPLPENTKNDRKIRFCFVSVVWSASRRAMPSLRLCLVCAIGKRYKNLVAGSESILESC